MRKFQAPFSRFIELAKRGGSAIKTTGCGCQGDTGRDACGASAEGLLSTTSHREGGRINPGAGDQQPSGKQVFVNYETRKNVEEHPRCASRTTTIRKKGGDGRNGSDNFHVQPLFVRADEGQTAFERNAGLFAGSGAGEGERDVGEGNGHEDRHQGKLTDARSALRGTTAIGAWSEQKEGGCLGDSSASFDGGGDTKGIPL